MTYKENLCSIVCITYNHAGYSRQAIESILALDYKDIEIVVIDDGSTDNNVVEIERALDGCGVPHQIITQKNTGNVPLNFNRALEKITGEYFTVLSLDDCLQVNCLSEKMPFLKADPNMAFIANTQINFMDDAGNITKPNHPTSIDAMNASNVETLLEKEFKHLGTFFTQGTLFRTTTIDAIGRYDDDLIGDDINLRTKLFIYMSEHRNLTFKLLHSPSVNYRMHENNIHKNGLRQIETVIQWRERFFPERGMPRLMARWISRFLRHSMRDQQYEKMHSAIALHPEIKRVFRSPSVQLHYFFYRLKSKFRKPVAPPNA